MIKTGEEDTGRGIDVVKNVYMWTEKVEKISKGKRKAGEIATVLGKPLKECALAESWLAAGWIEVKKDGA